jgi:hypothetical protein
VAPGDVMTITNWTILSLRKKISAKREPAPTLLG